MLPFGVTIPATVPQGSEIPEGLMNNPVYYNLLDITIIFSTPYPIYFLHTNTSHKLYFSPQVLQTKLQIHPLHVKNALTSPRHQPLRPHTHFGIRTRNPPHLSNTYSIGRTRRETLPNTPHTSIPDTKNRCFQRDRNHTAKARLLHLNVSVDRQLPIPRQFHSDRTFHFESTT